MRITAARRVGPFTVPHEAARAASLVHVSGAAPGIVRVTGESGFAYRHADGTPVTDTATLARIRALVIPPAWTDVWISPDANGHLQATGRDARRRKQYRYHTEWRSVRDETKYGRTALFGESLPSIRRRVQRDLARPGLSREHVLATIVRLLELTSIRIGNEEYARTNKSFGLTTMRDRHVQIAGESMLFRFRGKGGKTHEIRLTDKRLARLVKRMRDLPGQDLFQYVDVRGARRSVTSGDVNEYLRHVSKQDYTAKDFRTWAATVLASRALGRSRNEPRQTPRSAMLRAIEAVAAQLGNTPAICRKSYIHPTVLQAFEDESLFALYVQESSGAQRTAGLTREESAVLRFLRHAHGKARKAA